MTATAPSGVVTFLFTDIEGSTRRWEADADAMRAALASHDKVLRTAIEGHDGFLFSHTGDGFAAAFASPISAVNAAIDAQRELQLPVRIGIATGEAELRDGDYFGTVLNRAARVMAAGHGGQILAAESTAVLLSEVDLVDLGPRRLRDVPTPVGVFQVEAPDLRTDFPPLRTLDPTAGNLRPVMTSFIGRESEATEIEAVLRTHRLVTLTGVGGVGKTRLALEVARQIVDQFPDGVWVFELAAVADPTAVPDAVASVLGITQQPGKSMSDSVAAALEGRVRLLVFDNCEHVLDAAADLVEAILAHSATVRVLATSREGLGVADEQLWLVPSLDVDAGADSAAVTLFVERARSVAQRFSLAQADQAVAVVDICRRLDGIPLAIELAASRMASMTPGEVRDRLDQRFRLLVGSRRGLARHQTLRHAVAWSYDHLDENERSLLTRCSVFSGGFDLQSACAIAGFAYTDDLTVLNLLDALVRKSLLVVDRSSGRTRFSMLETIRQFGDEQLVAAEIADEVRATHARYFAEREEAILSVWNGPCQREAYEWLTAELANLRAAFRWAIDHEDIDTASTIAMYAAFLGYRVELYEPMAWAEEVIEPARAVAHPRLAALYAMASQCWMRGRTDEAVRYSDGGVDAVRSGGSVPFDTEAMLGGSYMATGEPERWIEWCRERLREGHDTQAFTQTCLVMALTMVGRREAARSAAAGLIDAVETTRNPHAISHALLAYGLAFVNADPVNALAALRRGLAVAQDSGNRMNESHLALRLAQIEAEHEDEATALDHITTAIRTCDASGNADAVRPPLAALAAFLDRLGRIEPAATIAGFAIVSPMTLVAIPEIYAAIAHLRAVLGRPAYELLARKGESMTAAAIATYAYDQIHQARAELNAVSE